MVAFHAGVGRASGGFVGVDVFFVLSGYLVTGLLVRDLDGAEGRIRFGRFYSRRARWRYAPRGRGRTWSSLLLVFGGGGTGGRAGLSPGAIRQQPSTWANWRSSPGRPAISPSTWSSSRSRTTGRSSVEVQFGGVVVCSPASTPWPVRRRGSERRVVQGAVSLGALGSFVVAGPGGSRHRPCSTMVTGPRRYPAPRRCAPRRHPGIVARIRSVAQPRRRACGGRGAGGVRWWAGIQPGDRVCDLQQVGGHGDRSGRSWRSATRGEHRVVSRGLRPVSASGGSPMHVQVSTRS